MSGVKLSLVYVVTFLIVVKVQTTPSRVDPVVIESDNSQGSCPFSDTLKSARSNLKADIHQVFLDSPCGGIGWTPVVSLDLGNPTHTCPSPWIESATPERSCIARNNENNCQGRSFPVSGLTYNRVCGRAVGYTLISPDAFADFIYNHSNIDLPYLDGVSVTHGSPRQHIWSFAGGHGFLADLMASPRCPCDTVDRAFAPLPPAFVGDNYFCDGEYNGALWDGQDCTTACCTFNSPPWFSVTLPAPSSDPIEVRICADQHAADENVYIRFLELFVQ